MTHNSPPGSLAPIRELRRVRRNYAIIATACVIALVFQIPIALTVMLAICTIGWLLTILELSHDIRVAVIAQSGPHRKEHTMT